ncbi:MAG: PaaI family thioesterase [Panacagrimonas sp.]
MDLKLVMTADEVTRLITVAFKADKPWFEIQELQPGWLRARLLFRSWMLRPGDVVSGPALFTAADLAMYALVLSHTGPQLMSVTSNLDLNFLNKGVPGDVRAEGSLLKLGRRLAVMEVKLRCGDQPDLVAVATGTYALAAPAR